MIYSFWDQRLVCLEQKVFIYKSISGMIVFFLCFAKRLLQKLFVEIYYMDKIGPLKPKHYVSGYQFYSKNVRKLRFHIFFHVHFKNYIKLLFYIKWTKFMRNCKFFPIHFGSPWMHNREKNWSTLGKILISSVFYHENRGIHEI